MKSLALNDHLNVIWHRKWIVLAVVVLITGGALLYTTVFSTPVYQSTTELLQRRSGLDRAFLGSSLFRDSSVQPDRDIETDVELVKSPEVVTAVTNSIGDELKGRDPASMVKAAPAKKTDIIDITASDTDPNVAADVANTFAQQYIDWRQQVDHDIIKRARAPIEAQIAATPEEQKNSASFKVLEDKLETLKLLDAMQTGDLEIVKPASVSMVPVSPQPARIGTIALFFSLILGIGAVSVTEQFDTRLRSADELTKRVDKPILASIPQTATKNGKLITIENPSGICAESYRLLKTNLAHIAPDKEIKSIMITSPSPLDSKSTTIANLAVTMARAGQKVIIMESDLRRPVLANYMGLDNIVGLTNAITGLCSLTEILQMIEARDLLIEGGRRASAPGVNLSPSTLGGIKPLFCATAGPLPPNPGELAGSARMSSLITEACGCADFVLVDAPPFGVVGDAASLASKVDGVIIVVNLAKTNKKSLDLMNNFIVSIPSKVLGLVVTNSDSNSHGYASMYGDYYKHSGYY
ncbi:MAG: tyrosine-protein kinase domain-containing protein [Thermoleophilia bacterium]